MRRLLCLALLLSGCDQLFPMPPDLAALDLPADAPVSGRVSGQICVLADFRDFRQCSVAAARGPIRVQTEDGQRVAIDEGSGFQLEPPASPGPVTLVASDARRQLFPAVVQLQRGGPPAALPMVPTQRIEILRALGLPLDPARGAVLAFVLDAQGNALAGAQVMIKSDGPGVFQGPFFEDGGGGLQRGPRTGIAGVLAVFELSPGTVTLQLAGTKQNSYTLPVVAGALTFSILR